MGVYINLYNFLQLVMWAVGLAALPYCYYNNMRNELLQYYIIIQSVMVLDILHVILKLVKGQILSTTLQIFSRVYVAWVILPNQLLHNNFNIWNVCMFTAWSLAEITRYGFYLRKNSSLIKWFRYSMFIVLYPLGVFAGEVPLIYQHYVQFKWVGELVLLIAYIPLLPYMFIHMLKQRSKSLKGKKENKEKKEHTKE
ncbi:Protein_tyrosine phosphatase-like protein [Hexamita inflata]|uniref:very-long-chain (3R)-3-hydroxyacyl-CoA dehydratase n=1 Tax=Hexamita inflata TaxID=28002 RepID=A0AA86UW46_9EUKA|nr:Protein tyrosine phosphatase-like protein [Hexamita inflata]